jgi:hypothetical protein
MNIFKIFISNLLIFTFVSCSGPNDRQTIKLKPKSTKLQKLRIEFRNEILIPFKSELQSTIDSYEKYTKLSQKVQKRQGPEFKTLKELDTEFTQKYGKDTIRIQKELRYLNNEYEVKRFNASNLQELIKSDEGLFNEYKTDYELCSKTLISDEIKIKKFVNTRKSNLKSLNKKLVQYSDKAKSEKEKAKDTYDKMSELGQAANRDKLKARGDEHAAKAKKAAKKTKSKYKEIVKLKSRTEHEVKKLTDKFQSDAKVCQNNYSELEILSNKIIVNREIFLSYLTRINEIQASVNEIYSQEKNYFKAYNRYRLERDIIQGKIQNNLNRFSQDFSKKQNLLIKKYGEHYYELYLMLYNWAKDEKLDETLSLELMDKLQVETNETKTIKKLRSKIKEILKVANIQYNKRVVSSTDFSLPTLPTLDITVPNISVNLPTFNFELPKLDLKLPSFEVHVPQVNLVHLDVDLLGDVEQFVSGVTSIDLTIPNVEFLYVNMEINGDIRSPGKILENTQNEISIFTDNVQRETGNVLHKVGLALQTASEPKNLARTALVYTASVYGGPFGSAMANTLMDKLINPNATDEELAKSFIIGAAAGYASEYASGAEIKPLSTMPNAAVAIARNLTTDLGNIILNNKKYTYEDFMLSIASGAANINSGDSYLNKVVDSALNASKDVALETVIRNEKFNEKAFEDAVYSGLAQGLTRESIYALMDKYIIKYIPDEHKRLDKKLIAKFKLVLSEIFLTQQKIETNKTIDQFSNLDQKTLEEVSDTLNENNNEFYELIAKKAQKDINQLTLQDVLLYGPEISEKFADEAHIILSQNEKTLLLSEQLELELENEDRSPAIGVNAILLALTVYGIYSTADQIYELSKKYDKNQNFMDFILENKAEIGLLGADAVLAVLPEIKIVSKITNYVGVQAVKVLMATKKLGLNSLEEIKNFSSTVKYLINNSNGSLNINNEAIDFAKDIVKTSGKEGLEFVRGIPELKYTGKGTWISEAGIVYGIRTKTETRLKHILLHTKENATKPNHTVFLTKPKDLPTLIDEAWRKAIKLNNGNVFEIDMNRIIGTKGERKMRIILNKDTMEIVSAYPIK